MRTALFSSLVLAILLPGTLAGASQTIIVHPDGSGDAPSIRAAVDLAQSGDTILLGDGDFTGPDNRNIAIVGKSLTIASQGGIPEQCVVSLAGIDGILRSGFSITDAPGQTVRFENLAIVSGWRPGGRDGLAGTAIVCDATPRLEIVGCVFADNVGGYGAALGLSGGPHLIEDTTFEQNRAGSEGGALYLNGANATLRRCVFWWNTAPHGAAIFALDSLVDVENCTLFENGAPGQSSVLHARNSAGIQIRQSIIASSRCPVAKCLTGGSIDLSCTDVFSYEGFGYNDCIADQIWVDGNFSADPLFCDAGDFEFNLLAASPCAPENNPECGLIGARPVGCGALPNLLVVPPVTAPIACGSSTGLTYRLVTGNDHAPIRSYSVRLTMAPAVDFSEQDISVATLPPGADALYQIVEHDSGDITIDYTILGAETAGIAADSDLFTVEVHGVDDGEGIIWVLESDFRDLDNVTVPLESAQAALVPVECGPPGPVTQPVGTSGLPTIMLHWQDPPEVSCADVEIFRGLWEAPDGTSAHPLYGRLEGASLPGRPPTHADAVADPRWTSVAVVPAGTQTFVDDPDPRGIYVYEIFARSVNAEAGPPADAWIRGTNYVLADVVAHDAVVDILDVSALGDAYATTDGDAGFVPAIDYGPTTDGSIAGLPEPDGTIGFEDLVILGLSFGGDFSGERAPGLAAAPASVPPMALGTMPASAPAVFTWITLGPDLHALRLVEGQGVKAIRVRLDERVDRSLAGRRISVSPGPLVQATAAPVFVRNVGPGLDAACVVLGRGVAFAGRGDLIRIAGLEDTVSPDELDLDVRGPDGVVLDAVVTGAATAADIPPACALLGNHPNPFNPVTTIRYALPDTRSVSLAVYGLDGRLVATLVDGTRPAGSHEITWRGVDDRGRPVASGTYVYRLRAGDVRQARKMVLAR
jgi:predicted outer membrane repeat protein